MNSSQVAELLVGIAKAQAAILNAITTTYEKGTVISKAKQTADKNLTALQGIGQRKNPISLETLPAKVFQSALATGSHAYKNILDDTIAELKHLLD